MSERNAVTVNPIGVFIDRVLGVMERESGVEGLAEQAKPLAEAGVGSLPALATAMLLPREAYVGMSLLAAVMRKRNQAAPEGAPKTWAEHFAQQRAQAEAKAAEGGEQ